MINILIVHYNTPKLTECLVRSINKYTPDCRIYIFDNSDKEPFTYKISNVRYIDNTKGQIIDFDKWLQKYPQRILSPGKLNKWGSAKHCVSVEKCMDIINDSFILLDSDILITKDITPFWDEKMAYVGEVITQPRSSIKRVLPYICFINVKMCKQNGVHYFDEKFMHGLRYSVGGDMYDTGAGFFLNAAKLPKKEIKLDTYMVHYSGGSWTKEKAAKIKYYLTPEQWLSKHRICWDVENKHMNKNVIYTCITGGYDSLIPDIKVTDGFDYICFTDNVNLNNEGVWELRPLPKETENLSNVKKQRYVKVNAHKLFPNYDLSIWVDGNIEIKGNVTEFIKKECSGDATVFIPAHPTRTCIYKESVACKNLKKDVSANIDPQMNKYRNEGFPQNYGLVQSNIVIRKHNTESCIKLMETWWKEIYNGSHRDQLSFNYALWKTPESKFKYLDKNTCNSIYFFWRKTHHKASAPVLKKSTELPKPASKPSVSQKTTPAPTPKAQADKRFIFGDSLLGSSTIKPPTKYKPQTANFVGRKRPKTKSMKAILSI